MTSAAALMLSSGMISNMVPFNILSFLGINKLWLYLAMGLTAIVALGGAYYLWKSSIEQRALMEYNVRQLQQTVREQEEFRRRQEALEEQQREATRALAEQNREVQNRIQSIQGTLNSPAAAASDRPASDILRRTVEQLRGIR